ncbi:MAG: TetR/AcrR family transcriptional regulator [Phaeospirillum sp.]|nr:TetR/AcrR family transcriptional regulator [Phaeospirillum sp.]
MDASPIATPLPQDVPNQDTPGPATARRRLPRKEREKMIVAEAIRFFAEVGFEGQTRALAQRLGVTQPLLYRYFPDKDALIDRVYRDVFLGGWDAGWNLALADRSRPLVDRAEEFYLNYTRANFSYERVRLFMFAGLKDESIANRYMAHVREHLFVPLCHEIRAEAGVASDAPLSPLEIELVAGLHGAIGYVGLRRWVYKTQTPEDMDTVVTQLVRSYLMGMPTAFRAFASADGR